MIYLDHNATTPVLPAVREAMLAAMAVYGNPSSAHAVGQEARQMVAGARAEVAEFLGARPEEVVFTGSGSEANNLAIKGVACGRSGRAMHVITSRIEHAATLEACRFLEGLGHCVTYLPVDSAGRVDPNDVRSSLRPNTCLVAVMHANNETGVVQPIEEIGAIAKDAGVPFFTDGVQTTGKLPIESASVPAQLFSASGHKLYGPKGIGVLVIRGGLCLAPLVHGGGQELGRRGGTENVLGIVGLAAACSEARRMSASELERQRGLRDLLWARLQELGGVRLNGDLRYMLPGTLNVSFGDLRGDSLALALSLEHIAVSTGSACHASATSPSHVLEAMGVRGSWLSGSLRFSLGRCNTVDEIQRTAEVLARLVKRLRRMAPSRVSCGSTG